MHLSKSQSVFLALGFLGLFFLFGIVLLNRSRSGSETDRTENIPGGQPGPQAEPTPQGGARIELKEFHRTETRDGVKVWEVTGKSGRYFPETNTVKVLEARLFLFKPNGDKMQLDTGEALLHLQGAELLKAEATGGVTMLVNEKYHIRTDNAVYDKEHGSVAAPGAVTMTSDTMDLSGDGLSVDVDKQIMTLSQNVSTVIKPVTKHEE